MSHHPEGPSGSEDPQDSNEPQPIQGQIRQNNVTARVPDDIGHGAFSNGVMILTGAFEIVLDYLLRMGEQQRVVARIILPHQVARQFVAALQDNIRSYEGLFGPLPRMPKPIPETAPSPPPPENDEDILEKSPENSAENSVSPQSSAAVPEHQEHHERAREQEQSPGAPQIDDIYHDLKLPDGMLGGRYANAVLIRHSGTEFCFDFIANLYPRSVVSARVFLAAPHVAPFLTSLQRSLTPPSAPGSSEGLA